MSSDKEAAIHHARKGWPAWMPQSMMRRQQCKLRVKRDLLGTRVALFDAGGACIEYVKLPKGLWRRWDGRESTFPWALCETDARLSPHWPVRLNVTLSWWEVEDPATGRWARYRPHEGVWVKDDEGQHPNMQDALADPGPSGGPAPPDPASAPRSTILL